MALRARLRQGARWAGPLFLIAGVAAALVAWVHPRPNPSGFEFGVFYTLSRYDHALSLVGVGVAAAGMRTPILALDFALLAGGLCAGSLVSDAIGAAVLHDPGWIRYVFLIGPIGCIGAGAALVLPRPVRIWFLPPVALYSGTALGLVVSFNDPTLRQWAFAGGTVAAGLWLVTVPLLLCRAVSRPWHEIPGRIFGSWLVAIGLMLGAAQFFPRSDAPPPAANASPQAPPAASSEAFE